MKTLFIFRDGLESKYLLGTLLKKVPNSYAILETGRKARKKKLIRTFSKSSVLIWPIRVLDLAALWVYSMLSERYLREELDFKEEIEAKVIEDVNDDSCIQIIHDLKPNIIIIFGTAIVRTPFFDKVKIPIFNIHTGILPKYRNVHSEFWAYKNKDFGNIGVTIIHLDKGIDSGAIALSKTVVYEKGDGLFKLKRKNLNLIIPLTLSLLNKAKENKIPIRPQKEAHAYAYQTPSARDLITTFIL